MSQKLKFICKLFVANLLLAEFALTAEDSPIERVKAVLLNGAGNVIEMSGNIQAIDPNGRLDSYSTVDVTFDLSGSPLLRMTQNPNAISSVPDPNRYYEYHTEIIYNGEVWIRKILKQGWNGEVYNTSEASISSRITPWLNGKDYLTGLCYLNSFAKIALLDNRPLIEILADEGDEFSTYLEETDEGPMAVMDFSTPYNIEKLFFSVRHGFALKRHEVSINAFSNELPRTQITTSVEEFQQISGGLFMPKRAEIKVLKDGKMGWNYRWELNSAELVRDATMTNLVKDVNIPSGWRVDDQRFGVSFRVAEDPSVIIKRLKREADSSK
jgi:hypothetical protein